MSHADPGLLSYGLPTKPDPTMGKILVTGASGYIGGRLVPELMARGYQVRILVRAPSPVYEELWPGVEVVVGDAVRRGSLRSALEGISVAYYLIHSMLLGPKRFATADKWAARNFRIIAEEQRIKRIIYLGGLGDIRAVLSDHLASRIQVARGLSRGAVPVTVLRAAVIIGSGSASYEIIKHLVRKLPVQLIPKWAHNKCQPIAIRDVIRYLVGVLERPETSGGSFDIGGKDILTYEEMMKIMAQVLHKRRFFVPFRFSDIRFYAYVTGLLTPVPGQIAGSLIEGLKNNVVCCDGTIRRFIDFEPLGYREAIERALAREAMESIDTRWSDAYPPSHELAVRLHELREIPRFRTTYSLTTEKGASSLFDSICRVGGNEGWFHSNWMWRVRGGIDRVFLGVGSARGRRDPRNLRTGDVIDFWRVEDIVTDKRLLLRAEMKLPGKAWLEFRIGNQETRRILSVTAYYSTSGLLGRLYWFIFLPFHHFIFFNLIKQIEKVS
jgi:uncharacterized protein YbjT (DUF2867 family)